jgi:hypothetical protein
MVRPVEAGSALAKQPSGFHVKLSTAASTSPKFTAGATFKTAVAGKKAATKK